MLSKNFYRSEFTASATADQLGIRNEPSEEHLIAMTALAHRLMQPLRDHYDRRVLISSGYRSPALNNAVGGSPTSEHAQGAACDFTVDGYGCKEVCEWIVYESGLEWNQLILEYKFDSEGRLETEWIHISFQRDGSNAKEVLTAYVRPTGTEYVAGLR